eukprot:GAHX01001267.1.p1 GENE.GAHX01001267.1~~GAHX01001267.1.p1  ORF type:complete len:301 (-),score=67.51 GAHX01001267.1:435-1337(-)
MRYAIDKTQFMYNFLLKHEKSILHPGSARRPAPRIVITSSKSEIPPTPATGSLSKIIENLYLYITDISTKVFLFSESLDQTHSRDLINISDNISGDIQIIKKHFQILENVIKVYAAQSTNRSLLSSRIQRVNFLKKKFLFLSRNYSEGLKKLNDMKDILEDDTVEKPSSIKAAENLQRSSIKQNNTLLTEYNESLQHEQNDLALKMEMPTETTNTQSIKKIQKSISQINELYGKLAEIVALQNDHFDRIDENIDLAIEDTKAAHFDVEQIYKNIRNNKSFVVKMAVGASVLGGMIWLFVK